MLYEHYLYLTLGLLLLVGVITDLKSNRIPNVLVLGGIVFALGFQFYLYQWSGLLIGISGLFVGLLLLLPFYFAKAMGAGDVKFMAMVGTFVGYQTAALSVGLTLVVGGVLAAIIIAVNRQAGLTFSRYKQIFITSLYSRKLFYIPPQSTEVAGTKFPYALAIALGTLWACYLRIFPALQEVLL